MKPLTPPARSLATSARHPRLRELGGLVLLLAGVLLLLALASYRPSDPSLDTAGARSIHNWTGRLGAACSDLLLQLEGAAAFALPFVLGGLGVSSFRRRPSSLSPSITRGVKLAGLLLAVLAGPALFALLPGGLHLFGAIPVGGIAGVLLVDSLVRWVNFPGACVLVVFAALIAVYLLTAFSVGSLRQWLLVRFAFAAALRDRWRNWRARRAQRRADRREAKALARAAKAERRTQAADEDEDEQNPQETSAPVVAEASAVPTEDHNGPIPIRRGSFAETYESRPTMASGWDDDAFSTELGSALAEPPSRRVKVYEELPDARTPSLTPAPPQVLPLASPQVPLLASPQVTAQAVSTQPGDTIAFTPRADADQRPVTMTARSVHGYESAYKLPPTTLLHRSDESHEVRQEALRLEAQVLVEKCAEFDVGGQVTQINPGPVVTTFEFRPDAGVKYSRVTGLSDDLCLAMAAESILIERMAGKSTVGIQVPNAERETIWLRDIIESESFAASKSKVAMAMGKDINGKVVTADLATMPHVLIAGSTGSGKSVAINAMIMSVLYKATPEQVRLILVDPKRVELGMYEGVPHLFTPIITEPKLAANALKNAVREMERRLKLLASRSVRNIDQYNRLFTDTLGLFDEQGAEEKPLPYIMIIIDELADLMILDKSNVEEAITRLAQMARAVGIHLVLATQRPSVDVITGLIKANVPTRMSFRLATKIDSRTILDANGAESLLGRGDMLFLPPGTSRLQRVHAPFVTEAEISNVVAFWKAQGEADYVEAFLEAPKDANGRELDADNPAGSAEDDNDPMFDDAVRLVFEFGKASTSLLQRRMRIGYGRAAHLIDLMERDGLVGPPEGSKPRELLKPANWLQDADEALR